MMASDVRARAGEGHMDNLKCAQLKVDEMESRWEVDGYVLAAILVVIIMVVSWGW